MAIGIAAWGTVAGVAMLRSGLPIPVAVLMSLLVFAGSAQLAVLPLIAIGSPLWVIWATALCVNLRFVVFSVQWRPYFGHLPRARRLSLGYFSGDTLYVIFMRKFPVAAPGPGQVRYFWGAALTNWATWQVSSIAGILIGEAVPESWGVGFAGTMALLGLACPLLRGPSTYVAAVVAGGAAVAAYGLPMKLNILVAIGAAVTAGVLMDAARPRGRK
ncbi:branched-chain amino acid ABC transporter permease [Pigmentiphaga sp. H8]|uniref:AzlC family ABC transporter permease n=1 Tax=Pigmentiphaga sp. H8 TaxID=2488560 RepID=UPI000F5A244D|nr:AzlC family ABC transporter permease [Pigmentiphaga sp. H8]AZG11888.1 branched-chain amino acid ABC transporter permease [Pigmentiphaga sp. H8]